MLCKKCKSEMPDTPFCPFCGASQTPKKRNGKKRGNGQGSVYKRGRSWQAEVCVLTCGVRERRTKGGFSTKQAALEYLSVLKNGEAEKKTLKELYDIWSRSHFEAVSDNRRASYERSWVKLAQFHFRDIASVRPHELQAALDKISGYYAKRDTKTVLCGIWGLARQNNITDKDPTEFLKLPKAPKPQKECFSDADIAVMWRELPRVPFLAYPLIMIFTGMEPGEIKLLTLDKIDFERRLIWGCGTKNELRRTLPVLFPRKIEPLLRAYEPFDWRKDKTWFYDNYKAALADAGIRYIPPNCCRHTTATKLARQKANPDTIQKIMRHSSYKTTLGYTHMELSDEFAELDAL